MNGLCYIVTDMETGYSWIINSEIEDCKEEILNQFLSDCETKRIIENGLESGKYVKQVNYLAFGV